jgi:hypothetical protein
MKKPDEAAGEWGSTGGSDDKTESPIHSNLARFAISW